MSQIDKQYLPPLEINKKSKKKRNRDINTISVEEPVVIPTSRNEIDEKKPEENKDDNKTTKEKMKEFFVEWSLASTSHGWPSIFRAKRIYLKVMWAIFLLISTGLCGFLVVRSILDFLAREVVTQIRLKPEKPIIFPAVTICNLSPFVTPDANYYILNYFGKKYNCNLTSYSDLNECGKENDISVTYEFEIMRQNVANPDFGDAEKKKFGFSVNDFIFECYFNSQACNMSEFEWFYSTQYGNCFKFNGGKDMQGNKIPLKKAYQLGELKGLTLRIDIGDQKENLFSYQSSAGARIFIHNQSIVPLPNEGINLQAGKTTNIQIIKEFSTSEPSPYSDCEDLTNYKSNLYNYIKNSDNSYRQKDCLELCYQMSTIAKCGCYDLESIKYTSNKPCYLTDKDYQCLVENYQEFIKIENNENCTKECPLECESINYNLNLNIADFPSRAFIKYISSENILSKKSSLRFTAEEEEAYYLILKERFLEVNFFFDDFKYTSISEQKKTSELDLTANIGGTIGLFVGISILSFIELVELLVEIITILVVDYQKKKKNKISNLNNKHAI